MSKELLPIYPNLNKIIKIVSFRYEILEIKLFEFIRVAVYLYDTNAQMVHATQIIIEGDEYKLWSDDDKYILTLLKDKIQNISL